MGFATLFAAGGLGCKRIATPTMDRAACKQEIDDAFLPQETAVLALRPTDQGTLFRNGILASVDGICAALEEEQTSFDLAVKCLTTVPLMEERKSGPPRQITIREELPAPREHEDRRLEAIVRGLEFATGDVMDEGGLVAFVHVPLLSFDGVDLNAVIARALAGAPSLEGVLDRGDGTDRAAYRAIAGDGPSASMVMGLYDSGMEGGLKELPHLEALERFQARAEALKGVAESFTIVDELKTVRRGLRAGKAEAYILPAARTEAAQLLLALSMSPAAKYGARIDGAERVSLLRVNLTAMSDSETARTVRKLELALAQEVAEGARAFLCTDRMPEAPADEDTPDEE